MSALSILGSQKATLGSLFPQRMLFDFFEPAEIYAPAPETYEQWRLAAIVPVYEGWYFHQPSITLIQAESESAVEKALLGKEDLRGEIHESSWQFGHEMWLRNRPWWMSL